MDLQEVGMDDKSTFFYGATLQKDPNFTMPCSWATADPSTFLIRGENYLKDRQKVTLFSGYINMFVLFFETFIIIKKKLIIIIEHI